MKAYIWKVAPSALYIDDSHMVIDRVYVRFAEQRPANIPASAQEFEVSEANMLCIEVHRKSYTNTPIMFGLRRPKEE